MPEQRKTIRRQLKGGMFGIGPRAVRMGATAIKRPLYQKVAPTASQLLPTTFPLSAFQPQMGFSTVKPTSPARLPVLGIGELGKQEREESRLQKIQQKPSKPLGDKIMYSVDTFPILPTYTAHQIMKINPRSYLACYKKIFNKQPEFAFNTDEEFLQGFFSELKSSGKLVLNGDGIQPSELSKSVNTSPNATLLEGFEAAQTVSPTLHVVAATLKKTAEQIPERIYPSTLTQQVNLFVEEYEPIQKISQIFLNKANISNISSFLSYEPSADVFLKANEDLYRVFRAAIQDGFDVNAFKRLFTPSRITKLKSGILNVWAKGDKQIAFQNLDKLILCVKYDVFTPMSLDAYLSTLNTKPSDALSELDKIYEESRKYERKIEEAPELEKIKSQTWHWYKYTTQGKMAGIAAVMILMCAMFGIYSVFDAQKEAHRFAVQHEVDKKLDRALQEIQILGESIQQKAIEPSMEVMKPVTEPITKGYQEMTQDARRRQYALLRWYNDLRKYMGKQPSSGGFRKTRKIRKI